MYIYLLLLFKYLFIANGSSSVDILYIIKESEKFDWEFLRKIL